MTTTIRIELACPSCEHEFESTSWGSTKTVGKQTTDFYQFAGGFQPIHFDLHTCPLCGFTGYAHEYAEPIDETLKERIAEKLTPVVREEVFPEAKRYEYAAWIAKWSGAGPKKVAHRYLKAAWCSQLSGDEQNEVDYRRKAIENYQEAILNGEIEAEDLAIIDYIIAELYRRVGEPKMAEEWYNRVPRAAGDNPKQKWVVDLAEQQKTDPKEFIE